MSRDSRKPNDDIKVIANYDFSPSNTLRWARALAILARIRRRVAEEQKEGG